MLSQSVPGALGLALRRSLYPLLLGSCGRNVVFGQNVVLRHPHKIRIGDNVVIDDNCLIDAKGESNAASGSAAASFVGRNTILSCKNGDIELGEGANIGFNCEIFSASRVRVGAHALLAAYCYLIGGDHEFSDSSRPVLEQTRTSAGITVGDGAWLGAGAKVLDGVTIGANAVIGAGAVVRASVPDERDGRRRARRDCRHPRTTCPGGLYRSDSRSAGLRSPRLGRLAHARRQAPVRLDDSALRSGALRRVARQPAQEGPVRRNARRARHRHHVPAQVEVRSVDADRRC